MAKNSIPEVKTGSGLLSKVISTLVVLGILALVIKHPSEAAAMASGLFTFLGSAIDGVTTFFQHLS